MLFTSAPKFLVYYRKYFT